MLKSKATSIAAGPSTPVRLLLVLIGKNDWVINLGWSNQIAVCAAERVCNYRECVQHLRNNEASLWNHQETIKNREVFFLVLRWCWWSHQNPLEGNDGRLLWIVDRLHFRRGRWKKQTSLVFVYLLYAFLLTEFLLLSHSKQHCQRRQLHKAQYTAAHLAAKFTIWQRTFFVFSTFNL